MCAQSNSDTIMTIVEITANQPVTVTTPPKQDVRTPNCGKINSVTSAVRTAVQFTHHTKPSPLDVQTDKIHTIHKLTYCWFGTLEVNCGCG